MDISTVTALRSWFDRFVAPFRETDPEGRRNIDLKIEHTVRVCAVMDELAAGERLSADERRIAAATALLHDVGRFPQYRRWRTFRDSVSDNHARLSVEVLREQNLLADLPDDQRLLVEEAVRFHNLLELPARVQSPTRLFMQLVRDADKLDIWRVFLDLAELPPEERASAATLGLPDDPGLTPACIDALRQGRVVRLEECRVVNDFKLMQMSWALDLSFATSRRLLLERGYLPALGATMNRPGEIAGEVERLTAAVTRLAG